MGASFLGGGDFCWGGSQPPPSVSHPDTCQMTSALPLIPQKKLQTNYTPSKPWKHKGMDHICDFSDSNDGYRHILVNVCYLSKYVAVRPLKSNTSEEVIQNLKNIYIDMGLPDIIQTIKEGSSQVM